MICVLWNHTFAQKLSDMKKLLFIVLALVAIFLSPALALLCGILYAVTLGLPFDKYTHKYSSLFLKVAVVGLGFGMNLIESLQASADGIVMTIFSVTIVMSIGVLLSKYMGIGKRVGYLISAGTAICGGSAIAAISPVIKAKANDTSMALAVVFTLNAIAMIIFPHIGEFLNLSQSEFGMWSAIAIHDTSAVVGAAKCYGEEALQIATTVKLSRALWIIPLSFVSILAFKKENGDSATKVKIPWFIVLFVVAMIINTYIALPQGLLDVIKIGSHKLLSVTLFLIGSMLSVNAIKEAGAKPIILGICLWFIISIVSLLAIMAL